MSTSFKALAIWAAMTLLLYLVGSFVAVSFNPSGWATEGRIIFALLVISGAVAAVVSVVLEDA